MSPERRPAEQEETPLTPDENYSCGRGTAFVLMAALHFVCCGLPLLLLSGVSLAVLAPYWPIAAGLLAVVGVIGFVWYVGRGCASCPRNEACPVTQKPEQ